jgi:hypothetical protein
LILSVFSLALAASLALIFSAGDLHDSLHVASVLASMILGFSFLILAVGLHSRTQMLVWGWAGPRVQSRKLDISTSSNPPFQLALPIECPSARRKVSSPIQLDHASGDRMLFITRDQRLMIGEWQSRQAYRACFQTARTPPQRACSWRSIRPFQKKDSEGWGVRIGKDEAAAARGECK